jgi:lantibiotic biosynthesis protein
LACPDIDAHLSAADYEGALGLAHKIAEAAIWSGDVCGFHGAAPPARLGLPAIHRSLGGDLYEGSAGIARLLALAASLTGDTSLRRTAGGAIAHAIAVADGWSLFSGRLGVGLAALEVAERLTAPELVPPAVAAIEAASEAAHREVTGSGPYDLLSGLAGVVVGLVAALPYDLDGGWRASAFELGRILMAGARHDGVGWSWPMHPAHPERLCGLAHGAAGVALALETLGGLAPEEPGWREAAARGRAFERAWYEPVYGSWADLRGNVQAEAGLAYPHMWCHGSVGIAAERIQAAGSDLLARADAAGGLAGAAAAARTILAGPAGPGAGDGANASQCHGLAGMAELFLDAWALDGSPEWLTLARNISAFIRADMTRPGGLRCGVPGGGFTPGLMLGAAGTAWAMFRAWNPRQVGSCWRIELGRSAEQALPALDEWLA